MDTSSREYEQLRLAVLSRMLKNDYSVVVACVDAVFGYTLPPQVLQERTLRLVAGETLPVESLPAVLSAAGYERCDQIEGAGQFAVRGGIVDVYPAQNASPLRIELWGNTVDTISQFDLLSQRRTESLKEADIPPAGEISYDSAEELAGRLEELAQNLSGKRAAAVRESLQKDIDRLRGGALPTALDKYLPLIYPQAVTS